MKPPYPATPPCGREPGQLVPIWHVDCAVCAAICDVTGNGAPNRCPYCGSNGITAKAHQGPLEGPQDSDEASYGQTVVGEDL